MYTVHSLCALPLYYDNDYCIHVCIGWSMFVLVMIQEVSCMCCVYTSLSVIISKVGLVSVRYPTL